MKNRVVERCDETKERTISLRNGLLTFKDDRHNIIFSSIFTSAFTADIENEVATEFQSPRTYKDVLISSNSYIGAHATILINRDAGTYSSPLSIGVQLYEELFKEKIDVDCIELLFNTKSEDVTLNEGEKSVQIVGPIL